MRLPLVIHLGGVRSPLSFCVIMTTGLVGTLPPVAVVVWVPLLAALTLLPVLLGVGGVGYYLWRGLPARRMFEQTLWHHVQATDDYEVIELHARLVPEGETRGAHVMAHYHWFRDEYESSIRSRWDLGGPRGAQRSESGALQRVRDVKRRSTALESINDIIASNAAFLSLSLNWERLWCQERQSALHELDLLLGQRQRTDSCVFTPRGTVEVHELVRVHRQRLSEMTVELSVGLLQLSAVLDELTWIRADVRRSADALAWIAASVDAPLGSPDLDVQHWMYTPEDLGVVEAGGDVGSLYDVDVYAVAGAGIGPYAPRRRGFLRDGTSPGV